jgi:hypothetical protein
MVCAHLSFLEVMAGMPASGKTNRTEKLIRGPERFASGSHAIPRCMPIYSSRPQISVIGKKFEYRPGPIGTARHDLPIGTTSTQTEELS